MPDRTINWGSSETEATYQSGDSDPTGGGNFVLARDTDAGRVLLEYQPGSDEWVVRGRVKAEDVIGNATYASINDIPAEYEEKGNMAYTDSDGLVVFE